MKIKKIILRTLLVIAMLIIGIIVVVSAGVAISRWTESTPQFTDQSGKKIPASIASLEKIKLGGYEQTVLIRGTNRDNPVLLFLHGGPGSSELPLVRTFNSALEEHFIVVLWDQKGAGKSYSPCINDTSMTLRSFLDDTRELVNILRKRFNRKKIYLAGHSWGGYLGLMTAHEHPELFYAYIGIGQVVSMKEGEKISLGYAIRKARESGNRQALKELLSLGDYPHSKEGWMSGVFTQRKWLGKFGGVLYGKEGMESLFMIKRPPEFTIFEFVPYALGSFYSLRLLWPRLLQAGDFRTLAPGLDVPVYFVTGRHDYNVPCELTVDYFNRVRARKKRLVWFEKSAHMPNFEEPEKFNRFMIDQVLRETF